MKNSFKKSFMFMMLLLALTFSAVGTTPALADDGVTPPTDAPVVEQPVGDAPVVAEDLTITEEPVAAAEETAPVAEVLDQLPEGTDLVVVDSSGEALPLASQEAAETISSPSADPFFWDGTQYVGYSATGVCPAQVTVCNTSATPLQAAITAFGASSAATGSIYVAAGTYTATVTIDGSVGNLKNLTGLIGEDSATTILNGDVTLQNMNMGTNVFTFQGFTLNGALYAFDNTNTLNITDVVQVGNGSSGIWIQNHTGNITLTDVDASENGNSETGAVFQFVTGNVTVTTSGGASGGTSTFNNNQVGMWVYGVSGSITINDVTIKDNAFGFDNMGNNFFTPILNCVTFSGNGTDLLGSVTQTSVGCGSGGTGGGSAYEPFAPAHVVPPVTPPAVSPVTPPAGEDEKGHTAIQYTSLYATLEQTQGQLPAALGEGFKFGSALKVEFTEEGKDVTDLAMTLSFPIPADMKDASLVVMFWNGSAWVEVSGGSVVGDFYVITVDQPGDYVLVAK